MCTPKARPSRRNSCASPTDAVTRLRSLSKEAAEADDRDSRMSVEVIGEDISADAITEEAGWKTAGARRSRPRHREADLANDIDARTNALGTGQQGAKSRNVKGKVIKSGRMPKLPKEEIKIVVRPHGSLDIVKVGAPTVTAAIFAAAGITAEESAEYDLSELTPEHRRCEHSETCERGPLR